MKIELDGKVYDLNIDQAKKLNLLKEDSRCKSWKEFKNKYKNTNGYLYDSMNEVVLNSYNPIALSDQLTKNEAIAIKAFSKLIKLRRDWIGEWNPNWNVPKIKYCITFVSDSLKVSYWESCQQPFSFPTEKMAKEFLSCFVDLFEQCKSII